MKPKDFVNHTKAMSANMRVIKKKAAFVGLPSENVGGEIYENGQSIIQIGARHEYGYGAIKRSFLRAPFALKRKELNQITAQQFEAATNGKRDAEMAVGLIGVAAVNVSKGAFTSTGYEQWADNSERTKKAKIAKGSKGGGQVLIDTGTLRASISSVVR